MAINIPIMSDDEYNKLLDKRKAVQLPEADRLGYDGLIRVGYANIVYRGIPYYIGVMRYYVLREPYNRINDINMYAVVEHPDVDKDIISLVEAVGDYNEFLHYDTDHPAYKHYTLQQHIDCADRLAKRCIDWLLDEGIPDMEAKMRSYSRAINKLKSYRVMMKNDSIR